MKAYPKYKPSNIEWIGEIPEHWEVIRLGYRAKMIVPMRDKPPIFNGVIPWVRIEDFNGKYISDSKSNQKVSNEIVKSMNLKIFPIGTVLCSCSCNMGSTAIVKKPLVSNQTFIGIVPHASMNSEFLYYLMNTSSERLQYLGSGAIQQYLSKENFQSLKLAFPLLLEQQSISQYLDDRTQKIDALIEKKQTLIDLLKEERTTIINQAVTKGLNPDAPMKDSGIEWLGDVPKHWKIKRMKYVAEIKSSNVDKKSSDNEIKVFLCNYLDVYNNEFIDNSFSFMEATANENEIAKFIVKKGDVLVTKDSETPDDIANPAYIKEDLINTICGYHLAQIRANQIELIGEYLFRLFQSKKFNSHFEVSANGITRFGLSIDSFKLVLIPLPPIEEQNQIAKYIETSTQKIHRTISRVEKEIPLLQEYRTSLISEVVTGKVDLREAI